MAATHSASRSPRTKSPHYQSLPTTSTANGTTPSTRTGQANKLQQCNSAAIPKSAPARVVQRARIVLSSAQGLTGPQIAERVGCTDPTVILWRRRYAERGIAGLDDAPRPGGPVSVMTPEVIAQVLADTVTPPPEALRAQGVTHWSARRLADWLGRHRGIAISHDRIATLWSKFCLQPHRVEGFKFSTDPDLDAKIRDVVGIYLDPPEGCRSGLRRREEPSPGLGPQPAGAADAPGR